MNGAKILFNGNISLGNLFFSFALGSVFSSYQKYLTINIVLVLSIWCLFYIFRDISYSFLLCYCAVFITILYLASLKFIVQRKFNSDISYGVYLWGFPVQQIISKYFLDYGVSFNQIASMIIACVLGYLSWHLIEKRSIQFGQKIAHLSAY